MSSIFTFNRVWLLLLLLLLMLISGCPGGGGDDPGEIDDGSVPHCELTYTELADIPEIPDPDYPLAGALWIAEAEGILKVTTATGELLFEITDLSDVLAVTLDQKNQRIWVAANGQLSIYQLDGTLIDSMDVMLTEDPVELTVNLNDGSVWMANGNFIDHYADDLSLLHTLSTIDRIQAIDFDQTAQRLWVAAGATITQYDSEAILLQTIDEMALIVAMAVDQITHQLWVSTAETLNRYDNTGQSTLTTPITGLLHLAPSKGQRLWAITADDLLRIDSSGAITLQTKPVENLSLINNNITLQHVIADDDTTTVWVVTQEYIRRLDSDGEPLQQLQLSRVPMGAAPACSIENVKLFREPLKDDTTPAITSMPVTEANLGDNYHYPLAVKNADRRALNYRLTQAPLGMRISTDGVIDWWPVNDGDYPVTVTVSDDEDLHLTQTFTITVTGEAAIRPVLATIGNQVAVLGQILTVQLRATDPNNQPLKFFARPTPLLNGMSLNASTGQFRFTPGLDQVGVHTLVFSVSNGNYSSEQTVTITVPEPDGVTRLRGQVLTLGNQPLPGVRLEINGQETRSDADGNYLLDNLVVSGRVRLLIDGSTVEPGFGDFATVPEMIYLIEEADNLLTPPIYLLPLDTASADQIQPNQTTTIESSPFRDADGNTVAAATMTIPPGAAINDATGLPYLGEIHISRVTDPSLGPRPLPPEYDLSVYVAIQPFGVTYPEPVPISFPNVEGFPPGSRMDFFALNHDTGMMEKIGEGLVSADGKTVDSIGGIVKSNSWHGIVPQAPVVALGSNPNTQTPPASDTNCEGCKINKTTGNLAEWHSVPSYYSLSEERGFRIEYNSNTANPHPIFTLSSGFGNQAPPPVSMSMEMAIDGIRLGDDVFSAVRVEPSEIRGQFKLTRPALQYDASEFSTGLHDYVLTTQCYFPISRRADSINGQVMIHNQTENPIGAGWAIAGLQRLYPHESTGKVLLTDGTETLLAFEPSEENPDRFLPPSTDYSVLLRNSDGTYSRQMKDGTAYEFDNRGLLISVSDRNGNNTVYTYDSADRLIRITDPVDNAFMLSYSAGKLSSVSDPLNRMTRFEHDSRGNLIAIIEPNGDRRTFEYADNDHLMVAQTDQRDNRKQYNYDNARRVTAAILPDSSQLSFTIGDVKGLPDLSGGNGTRNQPLAAPPLQEEVANILLDQNGNSTRTEVDINDIPIKHLDSVGRTTRYQRNVNDEITKRTRPNSSEIEQTFDDLGNTLTRIENFNGALYQYTYNEFSQVTSYTNPNGNTTTYNRDSQGNITRIINALGHTITMEYDSRGLLTRIETPNQLVITYIYNALGLVETLTETPPTGNPADSRVTTYRYDGAGQNTQLITPDGVTVDMIYDDKGRLIEARDNLNQTVSYTYDGYNNLIQADTHNANGSLARTVQSAFDSRNRLIRLTQPHSGVQQSVQQTILDNNSNIIGTVDPNGGNSSHRYDGEDRLIGDTHRLNGITQYTYDTNDRITRVVAPNGVVTDYTYDLIGRITSETSVDRGTLSYTYDNNNNLLTITDDRGITTTYAYDELERPISKTFPNTAGTVEDVTYCYDSASNCPGIVGEQQGGMTANCAFSIGRLCGIRDESGVTVYDYDAFGNIIQMAKTELGVTYITGYQYDKGNHVIQMRYPSGRLVTLSRDGLRRVQAIDTLINDAPQAVVSAIQYRADNQITQSTFGNELVDNRVYDLQGRLLSQRLGSLDNRSYTYDHNGNLLNRTTTPQASVYQYDALDRLIGDQIDSNPNSGYGYDLNHNRLTIAVDGVDDSAHDYGYTGASNRLAYIERPVSETTSASTSGTRSYNHTYNNANRWYQLFEDGQLAATYIYNAQGQRTRKVLGDEAETAVVTIYHYDLNGQLIAETDRAGSVQREYIWNGMHPVAQIDSDNVGESIHYLHTDHLYTPRFATNNARQIAWRWDGDGFGGEPAQDLGAEVNLRFPGQYFDSETGLHYNGFRYYDPGVGRYTQSDFIGLTDGLNPYLYSRANTLKYYDPDGKAAHIAIGAGIGGIFGGAMYALTTNNFTWGGLLRETAIGAVVGGVTAAVPGATASGALKFGGPLRNLAAGLGTASAAGTAGNIVSQSFDCEPMDYGEALISGGANAAGLGAGRLFIAPARHLATTTIPGQIGLPVTSLSGRTFMVGSRPTIQFTSETTQQVIQDAIGSGVSTGISSIR